MGNWLDWLGKLFAGRPAPVATRGVPLQEQSPQVVPPVTEVPTRPSSRQNGTRSRHVSTQGGREPSPGRRPSRDRAHSNPQRVPSMKDAELPPLPLPRTGTKSSAAPSSRGGPSSENMQAIAGECNLDYGWIAFLSLTMIRELQAISQTTNYELSRPQAAQFDSAASAPRTLQVYTSPQSRTS